MAPPLTALSVLALSVASTTMASAATTAADSSTKPTTIEHVLLFQLKPDTEPSLVDAMISHLRALASLDHISYLTAARILRPDSPGAAPFTLLLHGRYPSKAHLSAYSKDPVHLAVVKDTTPLISNMLAVDWVANLESGSLVPPPGSATRLTLVKLKEGVGKGEKGRVLADILGGLKDSVVKAGVEILQLSSGENFSPARAKGYSLAVLSVFPEVKQLDALDGIAAGTKAPSENVRPLIESTIVLDFVVPYSPPASKLHSESA